jgi:hypothetical protein
MKTALRILVAASLCLPLLADGPPPHAKREPEPDPVGMNEPDQRAHILRMAKLYNLPPEVIEKARLNGIGIGEIDTVVDIAKAAGVELDEVIAARKGGMTWTALAAKYELKLEDIVKDEEARTALIEGEKNLVKQLAERFKLSEEQVLEYRSQVTDWGEVKLALTLSQRSGAPVDVLIGKFREGHGWGTIAKEYELNIGDLMRDPASRENLRNEEAKASGQQ